MEDQTQVQNYHVPDDSDHFIDCIMEEFMLSCISENLGEHHQGKGEQDRMPLTLSICLSQEYDYPHPRHLCFTYPFGKTPFKKHCRKCYCYVCEEIAPCKKWNKSVNGHCRANEDEMWTLERSRRKKVPATRMVTMARHTLTISFMHFPADQRVLVNGSAGGMISDGTEKWVTGFSMHIHNDMGGRDSSVLPYIALIEGLKLAWLRGFRFINVKIGYLYHEGFWQDFEKTATGRFRVRLDEALPLNVGRAWSTLKEVESCLNQDWFIDVVNSSSIKEEECALALAMIACRQPLKEVYDFPSHPLTSQIRVMAEHCEKLLPPICDSHLPGRGDQADPFKELRDYNLT